MNCSYRIQENAGRPRRQFLVYQGIPGRWEGVDPSRLAVKVGGRLVPCSGELFDCAGKEGLQWLHLAFPVDIEPRENVDVSIVQSAAPSAPLSVTQANGAAAIETDWLRISLRDPSYFELSDSRGRTLLSGQIDVVLEPSFSTKAKGPVPCWTFFPKGFEVEDNGPGSVRIRFCGMYPNSKDRPWEVGEGDLACRCEVEFVIFSLSPVVKLRWRVTNLYRRGFRLRRAILSLPLGPDVQGEKAVISTETVLLSDRPGNGCLGFTAPFANDYGAGCGILSGKGRLAIGAIELPLDGALYSDPPQVHQSMISGTSITFGGDLVVGDVDAETLAGLAVPLPIVLSPEEYSRLGLLPEDGLKPDFGNWAGAVNRAFEFLFEHQWRGTILAGDWYRELDPAGGEGDYGSGDGDAVLAPLYHFFRTGDVRALHSARLSARFIWDIMVYKADHYPGWVMRTGMNQMDRFNIFPRYTRFLGLFLASHLFCDRWMREDCIRAMENYAEHFVDEGPVGGYLYRDEMAPGKIDITADAGCGVVGESLASAWKETGNPLFLEKTRRVGDWIVSQIRPDGSLRGDWEKGKGWLENGETNPFNLMFEMRGVWAAFQVTGEERYKEAFLRMAGHLWTIEEKITSCQYAFWHAWLQTVAARETGDRCVLESIRRVVDRFVSEQQPDGHWEAVTQWVKQEYQVGYSAFQDLLTAVAWLPVLSAALEQSAGRSTRHN